MNGISLLAIGNQSYGTWALSLARSIKSFHDIPIQLVYEEGTVKNIDKTPFDILTPINEAHSRRGGRLSPSFAKLSMYEYFPDWEKVMFIDVDTLCIAPFLDLFDAVDEVPYKIQTWGKTSQKTGIFKDMLWMKIEHMRKVFNLPDQPIPGTNSSFHLMKLGAEAEGVFSDALKAYHHFEQNCTTKDLYMTWGRKKQNAVYPDELFFNVALAKRDGYDGLNPIKFHLPCNGVFKGVEETVKEGFRFLGFWGDKQYNSRELQQTYSLLIKKYLSKSERVDIASMLQRKFVVSN